MTDPVKNKDAGCIFKLRQCQGCCFSFCPCLVLFSSSLVRSGSFIPFKSQSKPSPLTTTIAAFHPSDQNYGAFWDSGLWPLQFLAYSTGFLKKCIVSPKKETVSISAYYTGWLISPYQKPEVDFNVWVRGWKSIMSIPHLGRNLEHQAARKNKIHPILLLQTDKNCSQCYICPSLGTSERWERHKCWAFVTLRFPGLTTNPRVSAVREPTLQKLSDPSLWCLQGCERVCEDFTPGKTFLHLHCLGIFGT